MLRSAAPTARRSLLHLVVALATTWPLVLHIGHRVPLGDEDVATVPLFNLWSLRWTATTLPLHPSRWWDAPIFWPGHAAIVCARQTLIHANAFHMAVAVEPIDQAIARIKTQGSEVSAVRRVFPRVQSGG